MLLCDLAVRELAISLPRLKARVPRPFRGGTDGPPTEDLRVEIIAGGKLGPNAIRELIGSGGRFFRDDGVSEDSSLPPAGEKESHQCRLDRIRLQAVERGVG